MEVGEKGGGLEMMKRHVKKRKEVNGQFGGRTGREGKVMGQCTGRKVRMKGGVEEKETINAGRRDTKEGMERKVG